MGRERRVSLSGGVDAVTCRFRKRFGEWRAWPNFSPGGATWSPHLAQLLAGILNQQPKMPFLSFRAHRSLQLSIPDTTTLYHASVRSLASSS